MNVCLLQRKVQKGLSSINGSLIILAKFQHSTSPTSSSSPCLLPSWELCIRLFSYHSSSLSSLISLSNSCKEGMEKCIIRQTRFRQHSKLFIRILPENLNKGKLTDIVGTTLFIVLNGGEKILKYLNNQNRKTLRKL